MNQRYFVRLRWKIDGSYMDTVVNGHGLEDAEDRAIEIFSKFCEEKDLEVTKCRIARPEDEPSNVN